MGFSYALDAVVVIQSLRPGDDKTGMKLMQQEVGPSAPKPE